MRAAVGERLSSLGASGFLELFWKKSQTMWGSLEYLYWGFGHLDGSAQVLGGLTLSQCLNALNYFDRGVFFLAFFLAAAALLLWLRRGAGEGLRLPVMLSFLLCGYYAVHLLIEVQSRYRYFLMPAVFLLAGAARSSCFAAGRAGIPGARGRKTQPLAGRAGIFWKKPGKGLDLKCPSRAIIK